jgi:hypothetical protein
MKYLSIFIVLPLLFAACLNEESYEFAEIDGTYSIPLIDTEIKMVDITSSSSNEIDIVSDENDRLTVLYNGDVISQTVLQIFPPLFWFNDIPLTEIAGPVDIPFEVDYNLKKAIFKDSQIAFKFTSIFPEDIIVTAKLTEVFDEDGNQLTQELFIPGNGGEPSSVVGDTLELEGYTFITDTNELLYEYDARKPNGEQVQLDYAAMYLAQLNFSYVEGFFGTRVFDIIGDAITVGAFDNWLSGGLIFEDPKVTFQVQNSFGFPVRSFIEHITVKTITGSEFILDGPNIQEGVLFNYPTFDEIGEIKNTDFDYDRTNSNIGEIFNEKAASVIYDVDAIINSPLDDQIIGFLTDSSFYKVQVALEMPMFVTFNDLKLTDTFDLDLTEYESFNSGELKIINQNLFPFNIDLEVKFLDDQDNEVAALFDGDLNIVSGTLQNDGSVIPSDIQTEIIPMGETKFTNFKKAKKVAIISTFSNNPLFENDPFWILGNYGLNMKMGLTISNE